MCTDMVQRIMVIANRNQFPFSQWCTLPLLLLPLPPPLSVDHLCGTGRRAPYRSYNAMPPRHVLRAATALAATALAARTF